METENFLITLNQQKSWTKYATWLHHIKQLSSCIFKSGGTFVDSNSLIKFLKSWYGINKYYTKILVSLDNTIFFIFGNQKAALKTIQTSKKIMFIDNLTIVEAAKIMALRD